MSIYFVVFEQKSGQIIGKTYDEKVALDYVVSSNGFYSYQWHDDEKELEKS